MKVNKKKNFQKGQARGLPISFINKNLIIYIK